MKIGGRSGYEYFEDEGNSIYTIAQFFPRMAVYNEVEGWQNKQFLGRGEFTLPFGDYKVNITVLPIILFLQRRIKKCFISINKTQIKRWEKAKKNYKEPVIIVTQDEAAKMKKRKANL